MEAGEFVDEIIELGEQQIGGESLARVVEVIHAAPAEEGAAQEEDLFGGVGHKTAEDDGGNGPFAQFAEKGGDLVGAGGSGGQHGVLGGAYAG